MLGTVEVNYALSKKEQSYGAADELLSGGEANHGTISSLALSLSLCFQAGTRGCERESREQRAGRCERETERRKGCKRESGRRKNSATQEPEESEVVAELHKAGPCTFLRSQQ